MSYSMGNILELEVCEVRLTEFDVDSTWQQKNDSSGLLINTRTYAFNLEYRVMTRIQKFC